MNIAITGKDISIDWEQVRSELLKKEKIGPFDRKTSSAQIHACVDECLADARILATPKAHSVRRRVVSVGKNAIKIEKGVSFTGAWLASFLKGSQFVRLFLVTIGDGIELKATSLMHKGEHLHGYMLDRIGSMAVDSLAESAERCLRERYQEKSKSVSMRVSPGYCDWPVEEQAAFAKALDFSRIGVSLTRTCMMIPKKSISAMVGIAPAGHFIKTKTPCSMCAVRSCSYRR